MYAGSSGRVVEVAGARGGNVRVWGLNARGREGDDKNV